MSIVSVALPVPLRRTFDYLHTGTDTLVPGCRVKVPFGKNKHLIGIVLSSKADSDFPLDKLKPVAAQLDPFPLLDSQLLSLLQWSARYYQHGIGDVISQALPVLLRKGETAELQGHEVWLATEQGRTQDLNNMGRALKQQQALALLQQASMTPTELKQAEISSPTLRALKEKGLIEKKRLAAQLDLDWVQRFQITETKPQLNTEQAVAVAAVEHDTFATYLLEGITGSGKTEVYLTLLEQVLAAGKQALILVPEIGLTPQTINRFQRRFNVPMAVMHSALNDRERLEAWLQSKDGGAAIVIGTRSAVFTPFPKLGIIIIDEEHDGSFKQQDTFRYHARDLAIMRAHQLNIPIMLGSATPSLETLNHALSGKYRHLHLTQRAGPAQEAKHALLDIKSVRLQNGLSPQLIGLMEQHLTAGNQVMLFLNRRGYAPALLCHECGWIAACRRCDAHFTLHQGERKLHCHHCGAQRPVPYQCESCGSSQLLGAGVGTEQLEETLTQLFPNYPTIRIDRDTTRRKGSLEAFLDGIRQREYRILIGTQMLAKGHHFPDVTLVGLIDVDSALFSSDFRAAEKLAQLYIQVAGRAGRASKPGQVVLQTHHPEHVLIQDLINNGYAHFAKSALDERQQTQLPPFSSQALIRSESVYQAEPQAFLNEARECLEAHNVDPAVWILGPIPAPMERRAGKYRMQLLIQAPTRRQLAQLLHLALPELDKLKSARKVRWTLDVDPTEML